MIEISKDNTEGNSFIFGIRVRFLVKRNYKIIYDKFYHIFYLIAVIFIPFNLLNNFLSDYYFLKYILTLYKKKYVQLSNLTIDISMSNSVRKINDDNNKIQILENYYTLTNYIKYYIFYKFTKNKIEIKYFKDIHEELIHH